MLVNVITQGWIKSILFVSARFKSNEFVSTETNCNFPSNDSSNKTRLVNHHVLNSLRNRKIRNELAEMRKLNENLINSSNNLQSVCPNSTGFDNNKSEPIDRLVFLIKKLNYYLYDLTGFLFVRQRWSS